MSEYTPTTYEVRDAYAMTDEGLDFKRVAQERREAFDRWLAEHDRQVAERAWAACVDHLEATLGGEMKRAAHADNPYRKEQENTNA